MMQAKRTGTLCRLDEAANTMRGIGVSQLLIIAAAIITVVAGTPSALAEYRGGSVRQFVFTPPPLEAQGCYFYRGRRWCGRYCYYEINGKRYCQRREREAVPQAGGELVPVPDSLK